MAGFRCECTMRDCAFYTAVEANPAECDCMHTDKAHYNRKPCPLYRKDWNRTDQKAEDLKARLLNRKKH